MFTCLLSPNAFSQSIFTTSPLSQQITILPESIASAINCCVLPFNRIFVSRLTEVVWNNQSGNDVKLTIGKGMDCREIPGEDQTPYVVESILSCQVIGKLPQGKTRSVRLADPGQYDYTIEFLGTVARKPETGSIIVF